MNQLTQLYQCVGVKPPKVLWTFTVCKIVTDCQHAADQFSNEGSAKRLTEVELAKFFNSVHGTAVDDKDQDCAWGKIPAGSSRVAVQKLTRVGDSTIPCTSHITTSCIRGQASLLVATIFSHRIIASTLPPSPPSQCYPPSAVLSLS
jgi:hypothetical protein